MMALIWTKLLLHFVQRGMVLRVSMWADCDNADVVAGCRRALKKLLGHFLALCVTRHLQEIMT